MAATPGHLPDFKMMALFACGALLLRGAGCTINDLLDRDIDTMSCFGCLILVACLLLSPHEEVYILGWAAVKGSLDPSIVLPLYASGVFWTLVYDTIYAHQNLHLYVVYLDEFSCTPEVLPANGLVDKEDDLKVGVKSTALRFGDSTKEWITGFGIACLGGLALSGFNAEIAGWPYYASLAVASGHLGWQIWTVDLSSRADCNRKYVGEKEILAEWMKTITGVTSLTDTISQDKVTMMLHIEMFVLLSWCNCVMNKDLISGAEIMYNREGRMWDIKFNCQNLRPR
ncbi:hypothetical protein V8G54_018811 [Vigna mungo]|uniref:Uncharacterized protein n=1 Tax=Vigna mungo TaxID=3915 RepID=A0AAQ3N9E5_VIGMU